MAFLFLHGLMCRWAGAKIRCMKAIKIFYTRVEAEVAKSLLASHGIESFLSADDLRTLRPALALTNGVRLMVNEDEVTAALQVLGIAD